jgi:hypothetical protein
VCTFEQLEQLLKVSALRHAQALQLSSSVSVSESSAHVSDPPYTCSTQLSQAFRFDEDATSNLPGRERRDLSTSVISAVGVQTRQGVKVIGVQDQEYQANAGGTKQQPWCMVLGDNGGVASIITDVKQNGVLAADACWKLSTADVCTTVIMTERPPIGDRWSRQGKRQYLGGCEAKQRPGALSVESTNI